MTFDPLAGIYALDPRRGSLVAIRDSGMTWKQFMGIPEGGLEEYRDLASFARAPADEAWVYSCIRRVYEAAQGVPLRVYVRVGKELIPADDEPSPEGDDLQALLDYANPVDATGTQLKAYTAASYKTWGESFIHKVRGRFGGPPQELYWLRAPDIEVKAPNGRTIVSYSQKTTDGGTNDFAPR